jgi:hypothetical protein
MKKKKKKKPPINQRKYTLEEHFLEGLSHQLGYNKHE